jgi:chaperonin GroES
MIKPMPGYLVVEPIKEESQMGGIYLPQDLNDKPSKGKVVAVSTYKEKIIDNGQVVTVVWDAVIENNPIVIFKKWTNQEVKYEGKDYLLVKFDELLATL